MNRTFLIAGGDLRFAALAEKLAADGGSVCGIGLAGCPSSHIPKLREAADCLVLPLPATLDGANLNAPYSEESISLESLVPYVKKDGIVFGGMMSPEIKGIFEAAGLDTADYALREEFAVLNALATAEGAVMTAMKELPVMLSGRRILILGGGRIAKALISVLTGFHADIAMAARKRSDLAWAQLYGCKGVDISSEGLCDAAEESELIFNTVPALMLGEEQLKRLRKDCLVIDLASKPGGVDFAAAERHGIKALHLLSLPGKTSPKAAGEIIAGTIENILSERGKLYG